MGGYSSLGFGKAGLRFRNMQRVWIGFREGLGWRQLFVMHKPEACGYSKGRNMTLYPAEG